MWPTIVSAGISLLVALFMAYKARNAKRDDEALEHRFREVEEAARSVARKCDDLVERLHAAELKNVELEGELKVASAGHENLAHDVGDIKAKMVHRDEWESQMKNLHDQLAAFMRRFDELHAAVMSRPTRKR
jgi:chromosome segregation ATPase